MALAAVCLLMPSIFYGSYQILSDLPHSVLRVIVAIEGSITLFALAQLNTRTGYRKQDVALLAVPLYGLIYLIRVLWRGVHLPNTYWIPNFVSSELYRYAAFGEFVALGASRKTADMVALALFPLDDDIPASTTFTTQLHELTLAAADIVRTTKVEDLEQFAIDTLHLYINVATEQCEPYYASRFGAAVDEGRVIPSIGQNPSSVERSAETL